MILLMIHLIMFIADFVSAWKHRRNYWIFFIFSDKVCLGIPLINLYFVWSYLIKYAHNGQISDFSIFGIHNVSF